MKKAILLGLVISMLVMVVGCGATAKGTGTGGYYSNPAKYK